TRVFDEGISTDTAAATTLTFNPAVSSTLTLARSGPSRRSADPYTATYNVADANVNLADVTIDVTGAKDANGNGQNDYTPLAEFSIDTLNPNVTSVTPNDALITDANVGAGTFQLTVAFDQAMTTD